MSSIFRYTPLTYFQLPETVIETGIWAKLIPSAQSLYVLLLYLAQKTSSATISLTAADAVKAGLSLRSVKPARDDLHRNKLIAASENRYGFSYEILDPLTGGSLELIEDLARVDQEVVGRYFLEHLAAYDPQEWTQGLHSRCPFHVTAGNRAHPLHVTFIDGGAFKCHSRDCGKKGGIIDFELAIAKKTGETLGRNQAYGRVRIALLAAARRQRRRKAEELAQARAMM